MDLRTRIQTLFKEAEIYRQQGLLIEAKRNYESVVELLETNPGIKNREQLLDAISRKIKVVETDMKAEEEERPPEEMPSQMQDLVKGFFPAAEKKKDSGEAAFKGAVAMAQLRQFDKALLEFRKVLSQENLRVPAAKNILKCHLALFSLENAITEYTEWLSGNLFTDEQAEGVGAFFQDLLKKRGIPRALPKRETASPQAATAQAQPSTPAPKPPPAAAPAAEAPGDEEVDVDITSMKIAPSAAAMAAEAAAEEAAEEEPIEICSIEITPESGPKKGVPIEFDVTAQTGNKLHITVSAKDVAYIQDMEAGQTLNELQFFSHFVMFRGTGKVLAKRKIETGARKGDFNLSIRMEAPGEQ